MKHIALLATLDTKSDEARFVADAIRRRGHTASIIDLSLRPGGSLNGDTSRAAVARAAGTSSEAVAGLQRAQAMEVIAAGAATLVRAMVERRQIDAVIGIGGGTGTWMGTAVMRALPIGFPKLMVSTLPGRDAGTDIMVMPSVADIAGLKSLLSPILANAANAVCGMAEVSAPPADRSRPVIAMTMFGVTTAGGTLVRHFLEEAGCEVVVFHANGSGGATMEDLVRRGVFDGVLDWTTSEVTDELAGGICTAGPNRLEAAGAMGIPQLVIPGAVDVINVRGAIPKRFSKRVFHMHLPTVPLVRTSVHESRQIGTWIAEKLNRASGPVRVLIPAGGYSTLDVYDGPFWNPPANEAFVVGLRRKLRPDIPVDIDPHHINDEAFARVAAETMLAMDVGTPTHSTVLVEA
jgi:uncharacterized protein (UPF0261 family)